MNEDLRIEDDNFIVESQSFTEEFDENPLTVEHSNPFVARNTGRRTYTIKVIHKETMLKHLNSQKYAANAIYEAFKPYLTGEKEHNWRKPFDEVG